MSDQVNQPKSSTFLYFVGLVLCAQFQMLNEDVARDGGHANHSGRIGT